MTTATKGDYLTAVEIDFTTELGTGDLDTAVFSVVNGRTGEPLAGEVALKDEDANGDAIALSKTGGKATTEVDLVDAEYRLYRIACRATKGDATRTKEILVDVVPHVVTT